MPLFLACYLGNETRNYEREISSPNARRRDKKNVGHCLVSPVLRRFKFRFDFRPNAFLADKRTNLGRK